VGLRQHIPSSAPAALPLSESRMSPVRLLAASAVFALWTVSTTAAPLTPEDAAGHVGETTRARTLWPSTSSTAVRLRPMAPIAPAGRSGHEDRVVVCGFHHHIAGLKLRLEVLANGAGCGSLPEGPLRSSAAPSSRADRFARCTPTRCRGSDPLQSAPQSHHPSSIPSPPFPSQRYDLNGLNVDLS
jgi:hypothetical protein